MASYLNFPYDAEIFDYAWQHEPDVVLTNMIESGAVVRDGNIANLISNGSNFYTIPYYDVLGGDPVIYDGATDITTDETTGDSLSGAVYGRAKGWNVKSFIKDFNSGADPMQQVVQGVARYWAKQRQSIFLKTLKGVFGVAAFASHSVDGGVINATSVGDAIVAACGDNSDGFSLAIMHSVIANKLANLQMLEYAKYTDDRGIEKRLPIGYINGMTVIVNDGVGTSGTGTATKYDTYILGEGSVGFASAPVDVPSEMTRDAAKNGGEDRLYTRIRETFLPYGFAFKSSALTSNVGVTDTSIETSTNWELKFPAKAIKMVKLTTYAVAQGAGA